MADPQSKYDVLKYIVSGDGVACAVKAMESNPVLKDAQLALKAGPLVMGSTKAGGYMFDISSEGVGADYADPKRDAILDALVPCVNQKTILPPRMAVAHNH